MRFAFNAYRHEYVDEDTGLVLPHITELLERAGLIDDRWYTEESCERGSCVHRLTADYDLGAMTDMERTTSKYKGWLAAHVRAMEMIPHEWHHVEEPMAHRVLRFGGRPDRVGLIYGAVGVLEVKSGPWTKAHPIQTAIQAILVEGETGLPGEALTRYGEYVKANGRFKLEEFTDPRDFKEARRIIREYAHAA